MDAAPMDLRNISFSESKNFAERAICAALHCGHTCFSHVASFSMGNGALLLACVELGAALG